MDKSELIPRVYLSRRNLKTLLAKLDSVQAGVLSQCTLIKHDMTNPKYPQTHAAIVVTAVEDGDYYLGRMPGTVREDYAPAPVGEVVVTCDEGGQVICVSRNDSEGRILSIIWEAT